MGKLKLVLLICPNIRLIKAVLFERIKENKRLFQREYFPDGVLFKISEFNSLFCSFVLAGGRNNKCVKMTKEAFASIMGRKSTPLSAGFHSSLTLLVKCRKAAV
jgi:hypothetical protein